VIGDLRKILRLARHQTLHLPGRLQQSLSEHLTVFAALKRGDAPDAELTMRNHVLAQRDALRELARNHPSRIAP
jgi:DNA-binding GntR family transcriptional regulator